uniref:Uncharacterized protein n=1 Tax=Romanomermis culicivorax TaxID=13658 RepID=A0A915KJH2_ROMCU
SNFEKNIATTWNYISREYHGETIKNFKTEQKPTKRSESTDDLHDTPRRDWNPRVGATSESTTLPLLHFEWRTMSNLQHLWYVKCCIAGLKSNEWCNNCSDIQ